MKDPTREPTEYELAILTGLQRKPMYAGTVPAIEVDRRRVRNRAARRARRLNRQVGQR